MRTIGLSVAMGLALSALFAPAANAQQQPTIFCCAAPAAHVCQFAVQTGAVTPDCRAPRMDHWSLGQWLAVVPGVNSQIDGDRRFALR